MKNSLIMAVTTTSMHGGNPSSSNGWNANSLRSLIQTILNMPQILIAGSALVQHLFGADSLFASILSSVSIQFLPAFFIEVTCRCTTPFWQHQDLRPLSEDPSNVNPIIHAADQQDELTSPRLNDFQSPDEIDNLQNADCQFLLSRATFDESLDHQIGQLCDFINALEHQWQFLDPIFLLQVEQHGSSFSHYIEDCQSLEKRMELRSSPTPKTWEGSGHTMFYRTRSQGHSWILFPFVSLLHTVHMTIYSNLLIESLNYICLIFILILIVFWTFLEAKWIFSVDLICNRLQDSGGKGWTSVKKRGAGTFI